MFLINGSKVTRADIMRIDPLDRQVAHWSVIVDWDLQRQRNYVIVDPLDPTGLLYLNHAEYLSQSKVCASNDLPLIVVARPGVKAPVPVSSSSSDPSPPKGSLWGAKVGDKWTRNSRLSWKTFLLLREEVAKNVPREKDSKMVSERSDTIARTVYVWVRTLAHYAEVKNPGTYCQHFVPLVRLLQKLLAHNGQMAAVLYLKVSLFALYSYIGGNPLKSTTQLGIGIRLATCGLPAVFPRDLRDHVKRGKMSSIRLLASLLNIYRAMEAPHPDFDVSTIIKGHPILEGNTWEEYKSFCRDIFPQLLKDHTGSSLSFRYNSGLGLLISSAGANASGTAMQGIGQDAKAWFIEPQLNHVHDWFHLHNDTAALNFFHSAHRGADTPVNTLNKSEAEVITDFDQLSKADQIKVLTNEMPWPPEAAQTGGKLVGPTMNHLFWCSRTALSRGIPEGHPVDASGWPEPILGRLHAIDEPAGKVRVVAITDYWTQVAMKPVHEHLFRLLKKIGTDATFDQTGRVDAYFQRGLSPHWSFDLKAATDTIPLALYIEVLTPLLRMKGETLEQARERVVLWSKCLTDRLWLLPDNSGFVRYGTGQPMGALSSWASMAMVHHSLVQFAAHRATKATKWYEDYLVLGDDVDIASNKSVSDGYVGACADLFIIIGLAKTLQSNLNCFEFANQRFAPAGNISPLSLKEEISAQSWAERVEYAKRILARFGSDCKDGTSALLRKASTAAQWNWLVPEMTGLRSSSILNLTKFCLLNPFSSKDLKGLSIDAILKWVALGCLTDSSVVLRTTLASLSKKRDLESNIAMSLLRELESSISKRLVSAPKSFDVELSGRLLENPADPIMERFNHIKDWLSGHLLLPYYGKKEETRRACAFDHIQKVASGSLREAEYPYGYNSPMTCNSITTIYYVLWCITLQNDVITKDLEELLVRVESTKLHLENDFLVWRGATDKGNHHLLENYPNPFGSVMELWGEFAGLSSHILPNLGKPMSEWLVNKDKVEELLSKKTSKSESIRITETLRAPIAAVARGVAELTGLAVPALPFQNRKKGGNWANLLHDALTKFRADAEISRLLDISFAYAKNVERSGFFRKHIYGYK